MTVPARPEQPWSQRWPGWIFLVVILSLLVATYQGAGVSPGDLWKNRANIGAMAGDFLPPDFTQWRMYLAETWVTVQMAFWATALAVVCGVPLGLLGASNLAPTWVRLPVRWLMDAARAINEMVFALLFIVAVGPGTFAGVLALWVHTTGVLAKLFAEAAESIDAQPVDGIRATGAGSLVAIAYAVIPQVLPHWVSVSLYRFESNLRAASVLGIVGAGGIGMVLHDCIRSFEYPQTCAVLILFIAAVSLLDAVSARLRRAVL